MNPVAMPERSQKDKISILEYATESVSDQKNGEKVVRKFVCVCVCYDALLGAEFTMPGIRSAPGAM
jgi:hypothetical protein